MNYRKVVRRGLLGVVVMTLGATGMGYYYTTKDVPLEKVEEITESMLEDKIANATYGNDIEQVDGSKFAEAKERYYDIVQKQGIGSIYIPTANIALPILAGDDEYALMTGVGTESPTQKLGEGLYIGKSHNMVNKALLDNILSTQVGGEIYTTDYKKVYVYKATEVKIVSMYDSEYLEEPKEDEKAKILLYRCEGNIGTTKRAMAYGEFEESKEFKDVDKEVLVALGIIGKATDEPKPIVVEDSKETKDTKEVKKDNKEPIKRNVFERVCMKLYSFLEHKPYIYIGLIVLMMLGYILI